MSSEEETKPKKSVAFSDDINDMENADGTATKIDGNGASAESHSIEGAEDLGNEKTTNGEQAVDEPAFDPSKMKKKKKKVPKEGVEEGATEDTGFDATLLKKKKKKKPAPDSAFDQKLADAGVLPVEGEETTAPAPVAPQTEEEEAEDLANGTGVWDQSSTATLRYDQLLTRFFSLLHTQHPDLAGDGRSKSYKIPPPQVLREGNKKTIFANLPEICRKMKRQPEHVIQFLFAELGTSGSVDGNGRLVIKGRFQQKQLENVLRRYILEYLTCRTCKSPDTVLNKENRLYFITCNSCGSRRSVTTIKTGFQATVGKRKRMQT